MKAIKKNNREKRKQKRENCLLIEKKSQIVRLKIKHKYYNGCNKKT